MEIANWLSLLVELIVVVLGLWIAWSGKKAFGWLIALTFAIYVVYDLSRFLSWNLPGQSWLFLIASISICWAVWQIGAAKA